MPIKPENKSRYKKNIGNRQEKAIVQQNYKAIDYGRNVVSKRCK